MTDINIDTGRPREMLQEKPKSLSTSDAHYSNSFEGSLWSNFRHKMQSTFCLSACLLLLGMVSMDADSEQDDCFTEPPQLGGSLFIIITLTELHTWYNSFYSAQWPAFTSLIQFCKSYSVHMIFAFISIMMLAGYAKFGNYNYGQGTFQYFINY